MTGTFSEPAARKRSTARQSAGSRTIRPVSVHLNARSAAHADVSDEAQRWTSGRTSPGADEELQFGLDRVGCLVPHEAVLHIGPRGGAVGLPRCATVAR
jgi:hypothetical protein